jgi:hypothetical protein
MGVTTCVGFCFVGIKDFRLLIGCTCGLIEFVSLLKRTDLRNGRKALRTLPGTNVVVFD